jgi:hypothetical protein
MEFPIGIVLWITIAATTPILDIISGKRSVLRKCVSGNLAPKFMVFPYGRIKYFGSCCVLQTKTIEMLSDGNMFYFRYTVRR